MIKITFRSESSVYWAVCERLSRIEGGGYLLDSVIDDSLNGSICGGPHPWAKVSKDWNIILVEEA